MHDVVLNKKIKFVCLFACLFIYPCEFSEP